MKLIKPSFQIIPQEDLFKHIELCGRVCYKSEDKITDDSAERFVNGLIKSGHTSVLEHGTVYLSAMIDTTNNNRDEKFIKFLGFSGKYRANFHSYSYMRHMSKTESCVFVTTNYRVLIENGWLDDLIYQCEPTEYHKKRITVKFTCDRGLSHEIVRHRKFSFSQESTRYCNYSKDKFGNELTFIIPNWVNFEEIQIEDRNFKIADLNSSNGIFLKSISDSESSYLNLLKLGWVPQQARQVLPNSLKTELVMTGFIEDWKHFFELRTASNAHPQARELAIPLEEEFKSLNLI